MFNNILKLLFDAKQEEPYVLDRKFTTDTAVLVVHGFTAGPQSLNSLSKSIGENLNVGIKSIVLPGHNTNDYTALDSHNMDEWVGKVEEELNALKKKYKHVFILGQSMGGGLSEIIGSKIKVDGIILLNPLANIPNPALHFSGLLRKFMRFSIKSGVNPKEFTYPFFSNKTADELKKLADHAYTSIPNITAPIGLFLSEKDSVVPSNSRNHIIKENKSIFFRVFRYKQSDHVLSLSSERTNVVRDISKFIESTRRIGNSVDVVKKYVTPEREAIFSQLRGHAFYAIDFMDSQLTEKPISKTSIKNGLKIKDPYKDPYGIYTNGSVLEAFIAVFISRYGEKILKKFLMEFDKSDLRGQKNLLTLPERYAKFAIKQNKLLVKTVPKTVKKRSRRASLESLNAILQEDITPRDGQLLSQFDANLTITIRRKGTSTFLIVDSIHKSYTASGTYIENKQTFTESDTPHEYRREKTRETKSSGVLKHTSDPNEELRITKRFVAIRLLYDNIVYIIKYILFMFNKCFGIKKNDNGVRSKETPDNLAGHIINDNLIDEEKNIRHSGFIQRELEKSIKSFKIQGPMRHIDCKLTKELKNYKGIKELTLNLELKSRVRVLEETSKLQNKFYETANYATNKLYDGVIKAKETISRSLQATIDQRRANYLGRYTGWIFNRHANAAAAGAIGNADNGGAANDGVDSPVNVGTVNAINSTDNGCAANDGAGSSLLANNISETEITADRQQSNVREISNYFGEYMEWIFGNPADAEMTVPANSTDNGGAANDGADSSINVDTVNAINSTDNGGAEGDKINPFLHTQNISFSSLSSVSDFKSQSLSSVLDFKSRPMHRILRQREAFRGQSF